MNKKLIVLFICFVSVFSFGQTKTNIDEMLLKKYSQSELTSLKESKDNKYALYAKSLTIGTVLTPYTDKIKAKGNQFESLNINSTEGELFNYLDFNLNLKNDTQYFIINNGETLLIIKGIQELNTIK